VIQAHILHMKKISSRCTCSPNVPNCTKDYQYIVLHIIYSVCAQEKNLFTSAIIALVMIHAHARQVLWNGAAAASAALISQIFGITSCTPSEGHADLAAGGLHFAANSNYVVLSDHSLAQLLKPVDAVDCQPNVIPEAPQHLHPLSDQQCIGVGQ